MNETSPASPLPLTLDQWHQAACDASKGAAAEPLSALYQRLLQALRASADPAWIHIATDEQIVQQVQQQIERQTQAQSQAAQPTPADPLGTLPLLGVPFAVKDNIDVAGWPTTAACSAYAYTATASAAVVQRLQEAGAICVGKTNLDQFATGLVGTRSPYGIPSSAFSAEHVSGGSSSGSARAVAVGWVPFALGTDTAGSGRIPAGFNQLVGLKPTPGRVPVTGVVPACRSIDCVSVFALTVADAAKVLAVIEGPDGGDSYSRPVRGDAIWRDTLRVGVPQVLDVDEADHAQLFEQAAARLRDQGHEVVPVDMHLLDRVAALLYEGPWVAERHAVVQGLMQTQPEAMDPSVRRVIAAAEQHSATDAFRAQYALQDFKRDAQALWQDIDILMVPTAPGHPRIAAVQADPVVQNARLGRYTNFVNLLGWCALALPAAQRSNGLPFGVTFIAPGAADVALAHFGHRWQASVALPLGATGRDWTDAELAADLCDTGAPRPAVRTTLPIAVVGAHLSGMPLNSQLTQRGARLRAATTTAPHYRLYALANTQPPKPGMVRHTDGQAIAVEVWDLPIEQVGSFLALIPAPLGLGAIELMDGTWVHGFVCESLALATAQDITHHGGWRSFIEATAPVSSPTTPATC